jgi:hypothetical protein
MLVRGMMRSHQRLIEILGAGVAEPDSANRPSPTIVVPAQFFDLTPGRHVPAGIRRLMVAILEDAIGVCRKHRYATTRDKRRLYHRARRWFESDDRSWVFSFLRITEALGIEPQVLKRGLRMRRPPDPANLITSPDTHSDGCRASSS